jgi:hypothetical protein
MTHSKYIHEKQYSNFTESNKQQNIWIGHIKSQILLEITLKQLLGVPVPDYSTINCVLSLSRVYSVA